MDNCKNCIWSGKCSTEGSGRNCNWFYARKVECVECIWSGKCVTEVDATVIREEDCNEFTAKAQRPRIKTLTLFKVYQLADRNMEYTAIRRNAWTHSSRISVGKDSWALEWQLWCKMHNQAERLLVARLESIA